MKKIISLLLILILGLTVSGCSKETTTQKTEEELKAEIRAELEAEAKKKESANVSNDAQDHNNVQQEKESKLDEEIAENELRKYAANTEYSIDLNKDGQLDKIIYDNDFQDIEYITDIKINGNKYEINDIYADMAEDKFGIIDIDTSDNSVEFVLGEHDTPGVRYLYFYRYDGRDFYSLGSIVITDHCADEEDKLTTDGKGEFIVEAYSHIMEAGIYYKKYIIGETGNIELVPQKGIYTYKTPITSKVNEKIRVYKDKTTEASYVEIVPGEEMVIYGEIDNWLNIKWKDQELWINGDEVELSPPDYSGEDSKFQFDGIRFES
ncbi:hypothetical protein [Crassaminicella profunda]|uniref:hypothetical protein n=1 Tax=Crassaminicella profunda TaxID=1286698 RepID=UPI001CA67C2E|nr:hypothetical protein [Crassaminicella profunda]QZY57248.1 hypothetical protein K7H06_10145 [Crassaminicella profunda]